MTAGRFITIVVVGAAVVMAHRSHGSPSDTLDAVEVQAADLAMSRSERLREAFGRVGARVAGPYVRSTSRDVHRMLAELQPAIMKARPRDAVRARDLSARAMRLDSAALASLDAGEPMDALRYMARSRGLIPSVRQAVAEEAAFR